MDDFKSFIEGVTVAVVLSVFGGAARALRSGVKTWRQFAAGLFVSGFAGVVVHLLLREAEMPGSVKAALVGLSGYSGGVILDALSGRLQKSVEQLPHLQNPARRAPSEQREPAVWDGVERRKNGTEHGE